MPEAYIVAAKRTAAGRRNGALSNIHPSDLAGDLLSALVVECRIDPAAIDDVIMGCVSQAGEQSAHVGRNAVLASSLPDSTPAVTIDRQCGSSQQALHFAAQAVMSGTQDVVIAAGVESMSRVPMFSATTLAEKAGLGGPFSRRILARHGVQGFSQFTGAEMLAAKYGITRSECDAYACESHRRAAAATSAGAFNQEIVPVSVEGPNGETRLHREDEGIRYDASPEALAALKPLTEGGVVTAGNASQIADGASGVMVVNERALTTHGLTPIARIHSLLVTGGDPVIMLEEPIIATRRALRRAGLAISDIDRFEVNEAFACMPLSWIKALEADPARVNVSGGGIALGHPLGASGTKLMTTMVHALRANRERYGLQTMCEAGGLANVTIIEAL